MEDDKKIEKEIKESLELPEAPASVTYSVTSKDGYNALFTIRAMSGKELLETMKEIEEVLIKKEYKPQAKSSFRKEPDYVKDEKGNIKACPKCGSKLIIKFKKDGAKYYKCEKGGWDKENNKPIGCDFVDWLNKEKPTNPMTVEEYEDYLAK